jgi:hypothetical protein
MCIRIAASGGLLCSRYLIYNEKFFRTLHGNFQLYFVIYMGSSRTRLFHRSSCNFLSHGISLLILCLLTAFPAYMTRARIRVNFR